MRVELASDDDVFAIRRHIGAVRALGFGGKIEHAFIDRSFDADDGMPLIFFALARLDDLFGLSSS